MKRAIRAAATAVVIVAAASAAAQAPVYANEPSGDFLRSWLLLGPVTLDEPAIKEVNTLHLPGFEIDFLEAHGGERGARPTPGQGVDLPDGPVRWIAHTADDNSIDLDVALSDREFIAAYAYCEIEMERKTACVMALGSNDGVRVWLNGERVWDVSEGRGLRPDDDAIPVVLRKGRNRLLLKVEERGNLWGFACRFLPLTGSLLADELRFFDVVTAANGTPRLRFRHAPSIIGTFVRGARLEARSTIEPGRVIWKKKWSKKPQMDIGVDASRYGEYVLRVNVAFTGGTDRTMDIPFTAGKRIEYPLFENGASNYVIILGSDASESERWAAQELQHWLEEVSGVELPIRDDSDGTETAIVVGHNARAAKLLGQSAAPEPEDESFIYQNVGPAIVITGGRDRGTLYGVMTFLERELGCRWYSPRVSVAPQKAAYRFHHLHHTESPGIRVRNDFYFEAFEPIWAARNKVNGAMSYREQPGGVEGYWRVHTFYPLMPPSEFFDTHPEYYSLLEGERVHDRAQLCLTNADVLDIITERVRKVMRDNPDYLIYSVSQNDWRRPCECDKCRAIVEREGSESGPLLEFVNDVAERVEDEFPNKFIGTLAYSYTRKPPKTIRPRDNVVIRFCSIECCFAHDFTTCPENAEFLEDLRGWAAMAPHLYIWDYVVNFSHYIMPYPNFRVLQDNIRTFRDNNAIGIMEQAAYQSRGGEFAELRAYVLSKLLWDPECDVQTVINDFMYGYYGRAGQHVRRYFDLLHNRLTPDTHIHLGLKPDDPIFSDEFIRQADAIFDQAEAVADNEEIRQRVEMARLPLMYLKCRRAPLDAKRAGDYERFTAIVEREGITHYAEAGVPHKLAFHAEVDAASTD